ncbi:protein-S-isoprenylcysteine O-methyltransferase Ste14 [Aequitasia blattaphilus]
MFGIIFGLIGFICYIIYDINAIIWKKKVFFSFFFLGSIIVILSSLYSYTTTYGEAGFSERVFLMFVFSLCFFLLLIYTLFFALPFQKTYRDHAEIPSVCDSGVYALCRHPGFLWFLFLYLFLGLTLRASYFIYFGLFLSACNFFYICLQDIYVFPRQFKDYQTYKNQTPFLVPSLSSIRKCLRTITRRV